MQPACVPTRKRTIWVIDVYKRQVLFQPSAGRVGAGGAPCAVCRQDGGLAWRCERRYVQAASGNGSLDAAAGEDVYKRQASLLESDWLAGHPGDTVRLSPMYMVRQKYLNQLDAYYYSCLLYTSFLHDMRYLWEDYA